MFGKRFVSDAIDRSAENPADRRRFLRNAGLAGLGAAGASSLMVSEAHAATGGLFGGDDGEGPSDAAILNFALNLEYLEAEFYQYAVTGHGLPDNLTTGRGDRGKVVGGDKVPFESKLVRQYAEEIASDERGHVEFLRKALGDAAVARPRINLRDSFTAAARAAGLIGSNQTFDPYANENFFLLAAFIFEDVGVTAYKGAAPLVDNKTFLEAAAGILAAEGYHAANIRTALLSKGITQPTVKISNARDSLDNPQDVDQGNVLNGEANVVPTDQFGVCFSRTPGDVLNIVYLTKERATQGGFFPEGVNGTLNTSSAFGAGNGGNGGNSGNGGESEENSGGFLDDILGGVGGSSR